ncbi:MAG: hypothetical protein KC983_08635, partial [Phycisphaerales bacterium]|nr:hypothetical protein [Phycisphaerales bacterium]
MRPPTPRPRAARPAAPVRQTAGPRSIDPIRVLRRHIAMIFVSVVFGGVIGMGAHLALQRYYPLYSGEVLFEVQPGISKADDVGSNEFANDDVVLRIGNTQTFLLTSREVLSTALGGLEIRETEWHKQFIKNGTFDINAAIDELQEDLRAGAVRGSNVFRLSWSSHHPRDIPTVLNNIKKEYLRKRDDLDLGVFRANLDVFTNQLGNTQRELNTLTEQIKTYVRDKGITTFTDPTQSDIGRVVFKLSEDIADMTSALSMTKTAYEQTASKLQGSIQPTSDDIVKAEENPRMLAYAQQELGLKTDLRVALEKYQPDHPVAVEINRRLKATQFEREAELQELVRRNLESRLKLQADEIERIQRALKEMDEE